MKTIALLATLAASFSAGCATAPVAADPAQAAAQRAWLEQLTGEWTFRSEMAMGAGNEPMRVEGSESVRAIGNLWIVAEGRAVVTGEPHTTLMTLGYDAKREVFIGTWVDSMLDHMWSYTGELDEAKRVLTLETSGPAFEDPNETSRYRDAIELVDANHRVLTSSVLSDKGIWQTFQRAEYTRRK